MSKYNARKTIIDGIKFDSKKEAGRYKELKLLERAGEIKNLQLQPRFTLQESFIYQGKTERKITYIADFMYEEKNGEVVVEDVKSEITKTPLYRVKRKLFLKRYGDKYTFIEVMWGKEWEDQELI